MKSNNKLKGKDLINIGIYAAIYCLLMTCIAMLGYIPIMMPMLAVIVPIVLGVPMMLFYTKVKKFGMITIMGTIIGIYLCVMPWKQNALVCARNRCSWCPII